MSNYMTMGNRGMTVPSSPGMKTPYGQTESGIMDFYRKQQEEATRQAQEQRNRENRQREDSFLSALVGNMMGGAQGASGAGRDGPRPGYGQVDSGFGANMGGMRGAPQRQGRQSAEYYPMGMIPTASNMNHVSQFGKTYNYSGTPSMADMAWAPWRPESWDPNSDYINQTGGASPNTQWGRMSNRRRQGNRASELIDRARGRR